MTVLASQIATLANIIAGPVNTPETVFTALIRDQGILPLRGGHADTGSA